MPTPISISFSPSVKVGLPGGGGGHLVGGGGGEDLAGAGGIQHAPADEAGMQRLMAGAAAGDQGDLSAPRAAGPGDEDGAIVQSDDVGMGRGEAAQALGQQR